MPTSSGALISGQWVARPSLTSLQASDLLQHTDRRDHCRLESISREMPMNDAVHIANLLYRYAELMDSGDLVGTATLFERAKVRMAGDTVMEGVAGMLAVWQSHVRLYPNGTPMTKHVITNPIIEVDEAAGTATCRSYYTVLQATPDLPLQVICAGRYHDAFAKDAQGWYFTARDYSMLDLVGNMSAHLLVEVGGG